MTRRNPRSFRRGSVLVLSALSGLLMTGCTKAVFDAAAAGALSFIETGVITTLSSAVFGDDGMNSASTAMDGMMMDGMMMSSLGEHDLHGG